MTDHPTREEAMRKLNELIEGIEFAMLTTAEPNGALRSRPMATQQAEFDGDLWFFTHDDTPKVEQVERDHHVNVSYSSPEQQTYVSVSGTARTVRDRQKIEELWNPILKAWFPKGLDDPDLALLKVTAEQAEYWDSRSSFVAHAVGFVKAVATGEPYHPGENEKIDLK